MQQDRADAEQSGVQGVAGATPADLFENELVSAAAPFRSRPMAGGPGRPKGSANKRTLDMRDVYLRSGFPHPLLWQGSMLRQGIDGLATMLGCELVEAAELLRKIAADTLPYLESKMPAKIDLGDQQRLPVLVMRTEGGAPAGRIEPPREDGVMSIDDDLAREIEDAVMKSGT